VVERYDVTNRYVPVENGDLFVANQTWVELTVPEGRYHARIRTRTCGQYMGPWSDELQFSVEGEETNPIAVPPSPSGESAEGTRAFPGQTLIDASGAVWSFGIEDLPGVHEILRNGVYIGAWGLQLKYHNHSVYDLTLEGNWYLWTGTEWTNLGNTEP